MKSARARQQTKIARKEFRASGHKKRYYRYNPQPVTAITWPVIPAAA
jgi:hypothetical protein